MPEDDLGTALAKGVSCYQFVDGEVEASAASQG